MISDKNQVLLAILPFFTKNKKLNLSESYFSVFRKQKPPGRPQNAAGGFMYKSIINGA